MEMLCPECMAPLVSSDGMTAVCRTHGGSYHILFTRWGIAPPPAAIVPGAPPVAIPMPLPVDLRCVNHSEVGAVVLCTNCRAPVCATCDFSFPGEIHLCPSCAANPRQQLSKGRKKLIPWSIALAVWSIIALVGMLVAATTAHVRGEAEIIGMVFQFLSFWPALVGVALGVASFEKRLRTPGIVWIGIIGNALVVVIWILLMVVGLMMR